MTIQYHDIGAADTISKEYKDARFSFMSQVEGFMEGKLYFDSAGVLSDGFGFNLTISDVADQVISAMGLSANNDTGGYITQIKAMLGTWQYAEGNPGLATSVQTALDQIMSLASQQIAGVNSTFVFKSPDQARSVFDFIADNNFGSEKSYEQRIANKISGVPYSRERIALFSLAYNGLLPSSNNLKAIKGAGGIIF